MIKRFQTWYFSYYHEMECKRQEIANADPDSLKHFQISYKFNVWFSLISATLITVIAYIENHSINLKSEFATNFFDFFIIFFIPDLILNSLGRAYQKKRIESALNETKEIIDSLM